MTYYPIKHQWNWNHTHHARKQPNEINYGIKNKFIHISALLFYDKKCMASLKQTTTLVQLFFLQTNQRQLTYYHKTKESATAT